MKMKKNLYIDLVILFSILLPSCSTQVILPGLCYNDRDGTHLCPKEYTPKEDECDTDMDSSADNMCLDPVPEEKETDMEELQPLYDYCEPWAQYETSEQWMQCIMNEERRRQLLERVKHTA